MRSVLFVGCVVSRVLCVCLLFLAMMRTYVVMYVVREWITLLQWMYSEYVIFATTTSRKHVRRQKLRQNKKRHGIFTRKRYTVTVNDIRIPLLVLLCPQYVADFRSMYRNLT